MRYLVTVFLAVLSISGCTEPELDLEDEAQLTDHADAIRGSWMLEAFTSEGEAVAVEVDVNTAQLPVITFDEHISGTTGCNQIEPNFVTEYQVAGRTLTIGDVVITMAECAPLNLMAPETVLLNGALWADEQIHLMIVDGLMIWQIGDDTLRFCRTP